jgi:TonB-linked SusC/RagA family outer membrane protein
MITTSFLKSKSLSVLFLLLFCFIPSAFMQSKKSVGSEQVIKGKITDSSGDPVIGASLRVKGLSAGSVSDINGNYQFKLPENAKTLIVSYIGMKSKEVAIANKNVIDVTLESSATELTEVVAIGYGESKRKDLTGSVSSISSESMAKLGISDFSQNLQGRLAGVKVSSQSGEAGGSVDIKIRGANSINAGSSPLYVIDGMQIDVNESEVATSSAGGYTTYNPLATINPSDIVSIDVLKDASSTAIYGSRGANGVIIITTKSGSTKGKTEIGFNTSYGITEATKRIEMMNAQDYVNYKFARADQNPLTTYGTDTDGDGIIDTPKDASLYKQYNWQDLMLRQGSTNNYDLSMNTTLGKTRISSSLGYLNQKGIIMANEYQRYTGRIKFDHEVNSKLMVGASASIGSTVSSGVVSSGGGEGSYTGIIQAIYTERPIELYSTSEAIDYPGGFVSLASMITDEAFRKTTLTRLIGNAYIDYKITKDLRLNISSSANTSGSKLQEFYSVATKWGRVSNGMANISEITTNSSTSSATLNFNKKFNKAHTVTALIGGEMNGYHYESFGIKSKNFQDETTGVFDISKGALIDKPTSLVTQVNRMSAFGRASYSYKDKYYLTVNMRADASSNFKIGSRVGYFPSVSGAWRVNNEQFLKSAEFISNLKLRASMGTTGNDRIPAYQALSSLTPNYYSANGATIMGLSPNTSGNNNLKWESTKQYDLGIDLALFDSRISIVGDVYYKDTRDMLIQAPIPSQTGFTTQWQNIGRLSNKGIEVSLTSRNIETYKFSWKSTVNFDLNRNEVVSLGGAQFLPVIIGSGLLTDVARVVLNQPIGTGFGYQFDGNYQLTDFTWKEKATSAVVDPSTITSANISQYTSTLNTGVVSINSVATKPGDRKYKDLSGPNGVPDGTIDSNDRTIISNSNPKFNLGFGNEFTYGNFDLNFFFEGVFGPQIMNAFTSMVEAGAKGANSYNLTQDYWANRWTPENPTNDKAGILNGTSDFVSSYFVEDASYIRLKNLVLGYKVKGKVLNSLKIKSLRCYVSVENVYTWTKYSGMDPDVRSATALFPGFDRLSYPRTRSYSIGLNLTL